MIQGHLRESLNLCLVYPVPFSVMCFSVDGLQQLRERFGKAAVDAALKVVAQTLESGLRPRDFIGRWPDEEFLAILTECGNAEAMSVGDRLRKMVHQATIVWRDGIRGDQITQVRGFADQRLRKPDTPLDPVNRRISLIMQYVEKPTEAPAASTQEGGSQSTGGKKKLARARDKGRLWPRKSRLNRGIGPKLALFSPYKKSRDLR